MRGISVILSIISLLLFINLRSSIPQPINFLIYLFFIISIISLFLTKKMFIFSQTMFYSILILGLIMALLHLGLTIFVFINILVAILGEIVTWTLNVDRPVYEENSKLTDYINKNESLEKELPEDEIKEVIFIEDEEVSEKPTLFASKSGNKFHLPGCNIGDKIKEENRIYFSSESQARKKGYKKHKCRV